MARTLSDPFRVAPNGEVATVDQASDAGDVELIAGLCQTIRGERELAPGFGITDPTFGQFHPAEVAAGVARYGPPVTIESVEVRPESDRAIRVQVRYQ